MSKLLILSSYSRRHLNLNQEVLALNNAILFQSFGYIFNKKDKFSKQNQLAFVTKNFYSLAYILFRWLIEWLINCQVIQSVWADLVNFCE